MAKKETFESVSKRISDLKECEQTPEIMQEIDELTAKLEVLKPSEKVKKAPEKAGKPGFLTFEEWELEKVTLKKVKIRKECRMLQEHADILNEQSANTLLQYIEKEA